MRLIVMSPMFIVVDATRQFRRCGGVAWRPCAPVPLFMDGRLSFSFSLWSESGGLIRPYVPLVIGDEGVEFELEEEVAISMDYWYRRLSIGLVWAGLGDVASHHLLPSSESEGMMTTYRRDVKLEEERVD